MSTSSPWWTATKKKQNDCPFSETAEYEHHGRQEALLLGEQQYTKEIAFYPTCTKIGTMKYRCSQCNDTYEEKIPKTDHTWVYWYRNVHNYVYRCSGALCDATKGSSGYDSLHGTTYNKPSTPQTPSMSWVPKFDPSTGRMYFP